MKGKIILKKKIIYAHAQVTAINQLELLYKLVAVVAGLVDAIKVVFSGPQSFSHHGPMTT